VSDHDGVDDAHGHPADLGEDEREGEREHGTDLVSDGHLIYGVEITETPGVGFHGKVFIIDNLSVDLPRLRVNFPNRGQPPPPFVELPWCQVPVV
jgi:hypothetical protein